MVLHSLAGRRHRAGVLVRLAGERAGEVADAVALRVRRLPGGTSSGSCRAASRIRRAPRRPTRPRRAAGPPPRRAARSRGCCSGGTPPAPATAPEPSLAASRARRRTPGDRSHHGPTGSLCMPEVWASSDAHRRVGVPASPGRTGRSGRRGRAARRRGSCSTSDGGERLGDRADAVLRVGRVASGHVTGATRPQQLAAEQHAADDRRQPALGLVVGPGTPASGAASHARSLGEGLGRRAGADQVAVAVRLVDPGRPAASTCPGPGRSGTTAELARVGAVPLADERRARCAGRRAAASPRASTPPPRPGRSRARIAIIASQNRSISARSSDSVGSTISVPATGKRHRRRVEAVVDQPLGDVVDGHAGLLGQPAQVEDALVRDQAAVAAVEHREVLLEPVGDVVGRQHRGRGRRGSGPSAPISRM